MCICIWQTFPFTRHGPPDGHVNFVCQYGGQGWRRLREIFVIDSTRQDEHGPFCCTRQCLRSSSSLNKLKWWTCAHDISRHPYVIRRSTTFKLYNAVLPLNVTLSWLALTAALYLYDCLDTAVIINAVHNPRSYSVHMCWPLLVPTDQRHHFYRKKTCASKALCATLGCVVNRYVEIRWHSRHVGDR